MILSRAFSTSIAAVFFGLFSCNLATAEALNLPDQWKNLDYKRLCPKPGARPSMHVLARSLVSNYGVPLGLLDWNDTGITYEEYRTVLTRDLCGDQSTAKQNPKCVDAEGNDSKDAMKQSEAPTGVNLLLNTGLKDGRTQFDVVLKGGIIRFRHKQSANIYQTRSRSMIAAVVQKPTLAEELFSPSGEYFELTCVAKDKTIPPATPSRPSDQPAPPSAEDAKIAQKLITNRLRLRGGPDDLTASRENADDFKSASSATLSINNDNYSHKNTFDGRFAIGYAFPSPAIGNADLLTIPYVKLERNYTSGTGAPKSASNVENVGFGIQENILFPVNGIYGNLSVRPDYTYSLRNDAKVGKIQLAYEPYPSWKIFGQPGPIGSTGLIGYVTARAIINVGRVLDSGNDDTLADTNTFSQGGGEISALISVDDDGGSPFKGFSIPVTYTYLYGFAGQYKAVPHFAVGLSYSLAKYVSLGLSHTWGRNLDTFEKQSLYKLTLGVKY